MADFAVSFLFDQLTSLIQQEGELLGGIGDDAQHIRDELGQMRAFLRAADKKEESDPQLKEWVEKVREITYDTEDVLERYMLRFAHPRRDSNGCNQCIRTMYASAKNLIVRHQVASGFQQIKLRLENISKSQQRFKDIYDLMDEGSIDKTHGTRGDALLLEETDVVGVEEPKKQITEWLMQSANGLKVISVVGMGGSGKTTLVKKIYDDASVKADFDSHAWVLVSENFNLEKSLQRMIKNLADDVKLPRPQNLEEMTVDDMKDYVYKFLKDRTYMIVIDDIWKIESWESIRYIFPRNNARSRIIVTTRSYNIGNAACSETSGPLYQLNPLTDEESKELFNRKAFQGNSGPPYLSEISKSILKRCEGLPLAIVVIGSLLATKNNNLEDWKMFERTIGLEFQGDSLKKVNRFMSLSYFDLPYYLKACFLYLSIFHNDTYLEKWKIIRLWMAEGFVEAKEGKTEEEVAESYLNELHSRNLIQVADTYQDGRPRMYRIHDILREFIVSKSKELNFLPVVYGEEKKSPSKIRRMAINGALDDTKECYKVKYLRSLFWPEFTGSKSGPIFLKVMGGRCRLLKVLDIRGAPIDSIPAEVFKLYHLKYLSLRGTDIKLIPRSIINLQNLETLDLKASNVTELPVEILQLRKLRHLLVYSYMGDDISTFHLVPKSLKAPYGIGCLTSLQKLAYIDADKANGIKIVTEIGKLVQLRRLCITKLTTEDGRDLCSSLLKLTNLRSLVIISIAEDALMDLDHSLSPSTFPFLRTVFLQGRLEKFPQWLCSLHGLTQLCLRWSRLRDDPLQHLGGLPSLVCLNLYAYSYEGQELTFRDENFQKLQILNLLKLRGLRCVRVEKGSMPNLKELVMAYCDRVEELPEGVEHLSNLQQVVFSSMSKKFCGRYDEQKSREGNEWKLAHVPKVYVQDLDDDEYDSSGST